LSQEESLAGTFFLARLAMLHKRFKTAPQSQPQICDIRTCIGTPYNQQLSSLPVDRDQKSTNSSVNLGVLTTYWLLPS